MNAMNLSDVGKFGGLILSGLKVEEIKGIEDPCLRSEIIRAIGQIPLEKLMPVLDIEHFKNLARIGIAGRTSLTKKDLDDLGTLVFYIPPQSWNLVSSETIKAFMESKQRSRHHKQICLPWALATPLMKSLTKAYGYINSF